MKKLLQILCLLLPSMNMWGQKLEIVNYAPAGADVQWFKKPFDGGPVGSHIIPGASSIEKFQSFIIPVDIKEVKELWIKRTDIPNVMYILTETGELTSARVKQIREYMKIGGVTMLGSNALAKALELSETGKGVTIYVNPSRDSKVLYFDAEILS
jgi:hypothetical protein